jgi:hypothetical protein
MIVNVAGHGAITFPDTMSEEEVRAVLRQFEPKKDDTAEKLLSSIEGFLKKQKPQVITDSVPVPVDRQIVVKEPKVIEVERMVPVKPVSWHFTIEREDGLISEVYAEPVDA